jgi:Tol biopolymer transport system component
MPLTAGQTVGHFEILAIVGRGGMGDVFRARDGRLGREVAIKVLSAEYAQAPDGLPRFHREARLLATLAHPAIAAIHGLEEMEGVRFLVLEYVAGETLAEMIARGPIAVPRALELLRQVALGLAAAHEKGIIHRDLKPANIKVGPDGRVKILDFGIAKSLGERGTRRGRADGPTMTIASRDDTDEGVVLGTAAYMSPEQARGLDLDRRTDIWSFGCLLYESLTGLRAFSGETVTDIIAAVLARDPNWNALPPATPRRIRVLLRRCLQRDVDRRLHDIADARIEIEDALASPLELQPVTPEGGRGRAFIGFVAGALTAGLLAAEASRYGGRAAAPGMRRLLLGPLPGAPLLHAGARPGLAVSRDGLRAAYVAEGPEPQIYVRDLARVGARPVRGTRGGTQPFFSPDGRWLGFTADGKLKKVAIEGGEAVTLCDLPGSAGAAWSGDDSIVFAPGCASGPSDCGLFRVSARGGTPQPLTRADATDREVHSSPRVLPGGARVLYVSEKGTTQRSSRMLAVSIDDGTVVALVEGAESAAYASRRLLYRRGCALLAIPFDPQRLRLEGAVTAVAKDVSAFEALEDDTLFLATGCISAETGVVTIDAAGAKAVSSQRQAFSGLAVSPDGARLALTLTEGAGQDLAVLDLKDGRLTPLTEGEGQRQGPAWAPDGQHIAYERREPEELRGLYWIRPEPGSPEEPLLLSKEPLRGVTFTPDGSALAYERSLPAASEAWLLPLTGDRTPRLLLAGAANVRFSPDGRFVAYELVHEHGRDVWVASYPDLRQRRVVSHGDGSDPVWARDGKALYYRAAPGLPARILRAGLELGPELRAGLPLLFFEGAVEAGRRFDSLPGDRLMALLGAEPRPMEVTVISNWSAGPD